jgi:hypothetical protein
VIYVKKNSVRTVPINYKKEALIEMVRSDIFAQNVGSHKPEKEQILPLKIISPFILIGYQGTDS